MKSVLTATGFNPWIMSNQISKVLAAKFIEPVFPHEFVNTFRFSVDLYVAQ